MPIPRGTVIKMHVDAIVDPHEKYIVILGRDTPRVTYIGFLINSNVNLNVNTNQELISHHVELTVERNPYLQHRSYLDCAKAKYFPCEELDAKLAVNPAIVQGQLHNDDRVIALGIIKNSKLIIPAVKRLYGL